MTDDREEKYKDSVVFLPIMKDFTFEKAIKLDKKKLKPSDKPKKRYNQRYDSHLKKGQYDIDYVIGLLRKILQQCDSMRHNPRELEFSLRESLRRLLSMLEIEKNQKGEAKRKHDPFE